MPEHGCSVARDAFFSCMDLRTQRVRRELIDYLGIKDGTFDLISVPGGAGFSSIGEVSPFVVSASQC